MLPRPLLTRLCLFAMLTGAATACTRDSAAIQLLEYEPVVSKVRIVPLTIADASGAQGIGMPRDLVAMNGTLLVADVIGHSVFVLDAALSTVQRFGRAGSGPGELGRPAAVAYSDGAIHDPAPRTPLVHGEQFYHRWQETLSPDDLDVVFLVSYCTP